MSRRTKMRHLLLLFITSLLIPNEAKKELHLGGIFPMTLDGGGWPGGQSCLPAAQMALEHVNQMNILPGYRLQLHWKDSSCQPGLGARVMYELLYSEPQKLLLLSGCSLVTTVVAEAAHMWSLLVLSYGASSPALSNRARFPTLFRTHPSATIHNPTRVELFRQYNWEKIAIIQVAEEVFTETARDLERECARWGIDIVSHQSFYGDPSDALKSLKRQDARIIVGLFYEKVARRVFCQVYKDGLYGRRYVWFLIGWYSDTWFYPQENEDLDCTKEEMIKAAQYHLTTEAIMLNPYEKPGIAKMTGHEFQQLLITRLMEEKNVTREEVKNLGGFVEAPLAYDAIWALALALNCSSNELSKSNQRLEDFNYENGAEVLKQIKTCMRETNFEGVSGQVKFSDDGDRIAQTQVEQLQDGQYCKAYTFDSTESNLQLLTLTNDAGVCQQLKWFNDKPPMDAPLIVYTPITTSKSLFIGFGFVTLITACMSTAAGIFNWENKMNRVIAHSQVQVNNLFVLGCLMAVISVFLWGLPVEGVSTTQRTFAIMCHARVMLLSFGFTFAIGALFSKVWIVYRFGSGENDRHSISRQKSVLSSQFSTRFASVRSHVRAFRTPMVAAGLLANSQTHMMLAATLIANKVSNTFGRRPVALRDQPRRRRRRGGGVWFANSTPTGDTADGPDEDKAPPPPKNVLVRVLSRLLGPLLAGYRRFCCCRRETTDGRKPSSSSLSRYPKTRNLCKRLMFPRFHENKPIPIAKFYVIVGLLVFADFCVHAAWMEFDMMQQHEKNFSVIDDPSKDQLIRPYMESCKSDDVNLWTGLVLAPKAVLLLIAVFISYESRNLRLRYINDSGVVALAVYNVTLLAMVTVPILLFLIDDQPDARFGFITIAVLTCVIISLALVFVPKVMQIWKNGKMLNTRAKQSLAISSKHNVGDNNQKDNVPSSKKSEKSEQNFWRLTCEIDDMRQQIAKKDARIADLRQRINRAKADRDADNESVGSQKTKPNTFAAVVVHKSSTTSYSSAIRHSMSEQQQLQHVIQASERISCGGPDSGLPSSTIDHTNNQPKNSRIDWNFAESDKETVV